MEPDRYSPCELTELRMDPEIQRKWFPPPRRRRILLWCWPLIPILFCVALLLADYVTEREATLGPAQDCQLRQEVGR